MTFDAATWRAQHDADALMDRNPRGEMVTQLLREHLLAGTSRDDVLALLGPPERSDGDTDVYELGRSAFGVDYEQLAIAYEGGRLERAAIRRT